MITRKSLTFHEERRSRQNPEHGWKNSFHLNTDLLFEHNSQGCMKEFVKNKVWGKVRTDTRMTCTTTRKPILDLGIYTKNRTFCIPGPCKTALPKDPTCDPTIPFPSKAFSIDTRMADRRDSLETIQIFCIQKQPINTLIHLKSNRTPYESREDGKTHNQLHVPNWRQYVKKIKRELT